MELELILQDENQKMNDRVERLQELEKQNKQLTEQVFHLVKVERSMIDSQEKLDAQANLYCQLNEIAKRLRTTFLSREILEIALEFILCDLNFERCFILSREVSPNADSSDLFRTFLWDGYEDDDAPIDLTLSISDWPCLELLENQSDGQDFILSSIDSPIELELNSVIGVDEFIVCVVRSAQGSIEYLIVLGNTKHRAKLFSRVVAKADYLVVLSNLLAQVTGSIGQSVLYQASRDQAETLQSTISKLKSTQSQLIQTEKMSSLGQLVAGIAHEINNPVNFIYGNLTYVNDYTDDLFKLVSVYQRTYPEITPAIQDTLDEIDFNFLKSDFPQVISSMKVGSSRIQEIVLSLRNFSRMDESEYKCVNLHDGIESTLLILQYRLKANHDYPLITITKQYTELPLVECAAGLLNQVFMNLLSNSIDAMESACQQQLIQQPEIQICTAIESGGVRISIIDNGIGIPEHIKTRLFDPFFTTKPVGKGTGLGLSISYQIIVEKHQGTLECDSMIGRGTEFRIWIPIKSLT